MAEIVTHRMSRAELRVADDAAIGAMTGVLIAEMMRRGMTTDRLLTIVTALGQVADATREMFAALEQGR
jgi:hypothetical protein